MLCSTSTPTSPTTTALTEVRAARAAALAKNIAILESRSLTKPKGKQRPPPPILAAQAAKRTYRKGLRFALNLTVIADETTAVQAQQAPRLGRKLTARENQHPKQCATLEHAARLESGPEPLVHRIERSVDVCCLMPDSGRNNSHRCILYHLLRSPIHHTQLDFP
jgi:hypothetical protein